MIWGDSGHSSSSTVSKICVYLVLFLRHSEFFVETRKFFLPYLYFSIWHPPWHHKTRVPGLSCCVVCMMIYLAILIELVTDIQIYGHTDTRTNTAP